MRRQRDAELLTVRRKLATTQQALAEARARRGASAEELRVLQQLESHLLFRLTSLEVAEAGRGVYAIPPEGRQTIADGVRAPWRK